MQNISFRLQPTVQFFKVPSAPLKTQAFKGISAYPISDTFEFTQNSLQDLCKNTKELCTQNIKPENHINGGNHSDVYKIDCTDLYVLKIEKENSDFNKPIKIIPDEFDGKNFGQKIATNNAGVSILKKVEGQPLYGSGWSNSKWYEINEDSAKNYLKNLKKISSFDEKTLDNYVSQAVYLKKRGYTIDIINPNNYIYDEKKEKLTIIDFKDTEKEYLNSISNYGNEYLHVHLLSPLVDGKELNYLYNNMSAKQRKECIDCIHNLSERIASICSKYDIPKMNFDLVHKGSGDFYRAHPLEYITQLNEKSLENFNYETKDLLGAALDAYNVQRSFQPFYYKEWYKNKM